MNKPEVGKLLLLASGFDRRVVDDLTVGAWFSVPIIQQATYEDAAQAVINHQTGPNKEKYLTVGLVADYLTITNRQSADAIAADVRSARARGLISREWSERDPIPEDVRLRLAELRDESRQYAHVYGEIEVGRNVDFGEVGRTV
jgi:hypothetical protein